MNTISTSSPASEAFGMDVPTFAERLGCSRSYVWKLVASGKIKTIRLGKRRIVPSSELARILSEAA